MSPDEIRRSWDDDDTPRSVFPEPLAERLTRENKELRAEVERLRGEVAGMTGMRNAARRARDEADARMDALEADLRGLHVPWYEVNGVRHDHLVHVTGTENIPADHVCRIGSEWDSCEIDPDDSGWSVHVVPACCECRAVTEEYEIGYKLWPCKTIRTLDKHAGEQP